MAEEREVKLPVPDTFVLPDLSGVAAGISVVDRGAHELDAVYWDTETLALQRAGFGLRYRTTDGSAGHWTLKAESRRDGPAVVREEIDIDGEPHEPPRLVLDRVGAVLHDGALAPVVTVHTRRHTHDLMAPDQQPLAEIADDRVTIRDGDRDVTSFREVEVELMGSVDAAVVDAIVERLHAAGAGPVDPTPKYVRGLLALGFDIPTEVLQ